MLLHHGLKLLYTHKAGPTIYIPNLDQSATLKLFDLVPRLLGGGVSTKKQVEVHGKEIIGKHLNFTITNRGYPHLGASPR